MAEQAASWYDITVAGKRFNIASRQDEVQIREVERLLNETFEQVSARVTGQPALNIALLTALNLADQLVNQRMAENGAADDLHRRVEGLVTQLQAALDGSMAEPSADAG
jgi:cell division protein ZapA (FtsZ GTPase activity inhibitor)